jgi:DNA-binding NarL/FixJ family response regulator
MQSSRAGTAMPGNDLYGNRVPSLRQREVIALVAQGLKNSDVAAVIGTTECVVKNYLRLIYDKLGLWNRVELALWYEARKHENVGGTSAQPMGMN